MRKEAARYASQPSIELNGGAGLLVDLSVDGCQLLSAAALKPHQVVKMLLSSEGVSIACTGKVAWMRLDPPQPGQLFSYRAGVAFTQPDEPALEAFMTTHGERNPRKGCIMVTDRP